MHVYCGWWRKRGKKARCSDDTITNAKDNSIATMDSPVTLKMDQVKSSWSYHCEKVWKLTQQGLCPVFPLNACWLLNVQLLWYCQCTCNHDVDSELLYHFIFNAQSTMKVISGQNIIHEITSKRIDDSPCSWYTLLPFRWRLENEKRSWMNRNGRISDRRQSMQKQYSGLLQV